MLFFLGFSPAASGGCSDFIDPCQPMRAAPRPGPGYHPTWRCGERSALSASVPRQHSSRHHPPKNPTTFPPTFPTIPAIITPEEREENRHAPLVSPQPSPEPVPRARSPHPPPAPSLLQKTTDCYNFSIAPRPARARQHIPPQNSPVFPIRAKNRPAATPCGTNPPAKMAVTPNPLSAIPNRQSTFEPPACPLPTPLAIYTQKGSAERIRSGTVRYRWIPRKERHGRLGPAQSVR
jgi:hypothetical protein